MHLVPFSPCSVVAHSPPDPRLSWLRPVCPDGRWDGLDHVWIQMRATNLHGGCPPGGNYF